MENGAPLLPENALSPEGTQFIPWLLSLVRETNSPLAAATNLDIGLAVAEALPWINDPDLSEDRLRLLEVLARLALSLCQNTFELRPLQCCRFLLEKAMQGRDSTLDHDDDGSLARLRQLYAQALYQSYLRDPDDNSALDAAVEMAEDSVRRTEALLVERKLDLWTCLSQKARSSTDEAEARRFLTWSVGVAEEVYDWVRSSNDDDDEGGPLWFRAVNNLALSYQVRWDMTETSYDDLVRSIELGQALCQSLAAPEWEGQPDARTTGLSNLSFRLLRAYGHWISTGELSTRLGYQDGEELLDQAVLCLKQSIDTLCERTRSHLENALTFVRQIDKLPKDVRPSVLGRISGVLAACVNRMREMALYAIREDLLESVGTFFGLARYAAAASLEAGAAPYDALSILEEGRGLAISIQLDSRPDNLHAQSLRAEYSEARRKLLACVDGGAALYERHALVEKVLDLQRQINARVPGFETCPSAENLREVAGEATIVVINITTIRSDAFIISSDGIRVHTLPNLDEDDLSLQSTRIQEGLDQRSNDDDVARTTFSEVIEALKILWKHLVHPVLKEIGRDHPHQDDSMPWHHVCWVPAGVLGLYPIHAAGRYKRARPHDAGTMSCVVSSYAPSLKILSKTRASSLSRPSRRPPAATAEFPTTPDVPPLNSIRAAVISEAQPPDSDRMAFHPLAAAKQGTEIIRQTFSTAVGGDAGDGILTDPDKSSVLDLLNRNIPIVQFFCHGIVDHDEPLNSKLLLRDWQTDPLTAGTLMRLDLHGSRLAFLSACWGAHGGAEKMQDEINHVACALQVAGFPNVIGSLWEAVEEDMICLMRAFYRTLDQASTAGGGGDGLLTAKNIGEALHVAVMEVRERSFEDNALLGNPLRWAPFVRFGI